MVEVAAPEFDDDVLIIGSGFGGSVSALRLTETGYRVGVIVIKSVPLALHVQAQGDSQSKLLSLIQHTAVDHVPCTQRIATTRC